MSENVIDRARLWLKANLFRRRHEQEMRDEMAAHLEKATALHVARGLSIDDAKKQARRDFGDVAYHQMEARDARGTLWLDALGADMRFALRHFARRPITTLVMFIILVVGMSISSLLFSIVNSFAFQAPPAVEMQKDLVRIRGMDGPPGDQGTRAFVREEFDAFRDMSQFTSVAGWVDADAAFLEANNAERRAVTSRVNFVTDNYFDVLGLRMAAGPGLPRGEAGDAARNLAVVISHDTWDRLFQKSRDAIGSSLSLNGVNVTIVGVAPERFTGVYGQTRLQVWMAMAAMPLIAPRGNEGYKAFARLRPGVSSEAATAAVNAIAVRAGALTPERRKEVFSADVAPMLSANIDSNFNYIVRLQFFMIGGIALLVLLVTCTNVSALLTGLASARRQEIAVRLSLGAARARIIRQLLTESAVLAVLAAVTALGVVHLFMTTAHKLLPQLPIVFEITWSLTIFTFAVALTTGIAFGLSPALHATRMALASVLRDSSRGVGTRGRLQQTLVIAQIAFTQPLVVALAAFLVIVLGTYQPRVQTDFPDRVVSLSVEPLSSSAATHEERRALMLRLVDRLRATPGVDKVAINWASGQSPWPGKYEALDSRASKTDVDIQPRQVAQEHFSVLGVPVKYGRAFGPVDLAAVHSARADIPVIIGSDLAAQMWGNGDPVGRRMKTLMDTATSMRTLVVVGVVDDPIARSRPDGEAWTVYVPADTSKVPLSMLISTTSAAQNLLPSLREVVIKEAPGAVTEVNTLAGIADVERRNLRYVYSGITAAAGIALTLAAIGLYAVVAFSVAQRRHEIAVRLSVGARGGQIARAFVGNGLKLSAIGMAIGLPLSLIALKFLINPRLVLSVPLSPVAFIAAVAVIVVAAAAAYIPARRAAAVDPANVLRTG